VGVNPIQKAGKDFKKKIGPNFKPKGNIYQTPVKGGRTPNWNKWKEYTQEIGKWE